MMRHLLLRMLSGSASDFTLHPCLIAVKKSKVVTGGEKIRAFELPFRGHLEGLGGLCEAVEEKIVESNASPRGCDARIELCGLLRGLNSPFILAGTECDPTRDNAGGVCIA